MDKKKKIRVIIPVLLVGLLVFLVFSLIKKKLSNENSLKGSGTIEVVEINVSSKITGRIKKLHVDEGDLIKQNQILASIEKEEISGKYEEAKAAYQEAVEKRESIKANLENARINLKRFTELSESNPEYYKKPLDDAKTVFNSYAAEYRASLATINRVKSQLEVAEYNSKEYNVFSPIQGTVLRKYFEENELVMPGSIIFTCANLKDVYLKIYIPEYHLGKVKLGQQVNIKNDTYPNRVYRGKITQISQQAEFTPKNIQTEEERVRLVFGIKISIENQSLELKPGMPADAEILIGSGQ